MYINLSVIYCKLGARKEKTEAINFKIRIESKSAATNILAKKRRTQIIRYVPKINSLSRFFFAAKRKLQQKEREDDAKKIPFTEPFLIFTNINRASPI